MTEKGQKPDKSIDLNPHDAFFADFGTEFLPDVLATASNETANDAKQLLVANQCLDVIDLVNGQPVINVQKSSPENEQRILDGLLHAWRKTSDGSTISLEPLLQSCDKEGPFRGFAAVLTPKQRSSLREADNALCLACYEQFTRLQNGAIVVETIAKIYRQLPDVEPLLAKISNPQMGEHMQNLLSLWRTNLRNPHINRYYRSMSYSAKDQLATRQYAVPMMKQNLAFFSVGLLPENAEDEAGYSAVSRTLLTKRFQEELSIIDIGGILHESTHIRQHNDFIEKYSAGDVENLEKCQKAYLSGFFGEQHSNSADRRVASVLEDEVEAFATTLELLRARLGFYNRDVNKAISFLGIPSTDKLKRELDFHLYLAEIYFNNPAAFPDEIAKGYKQQNIPMKVRAQIKPPQ